MATLTKNPIHSGDGERKTTELTKMSSVKSTNTASPKNNRTRRTSIALTDEAFRQRLKRLNIQDTKTGLSLYEHIWKWRGNESLDGVDALVATFHQFAATIDKTRVGVSRVIFELPAERSKHSGRQAARNNQNHLRLKTTMALREVMEMVVSSNDSIRIVLFHDITKGGDMDRIDDLVNEIKQQFGTLFEKELVSPKLRDMLTKVYQSNPSDERNELQQEIGTNFTTFATQVGHAIAKVSRSSFR
jgi:hypothetical protein|tara:strand:- start:531 stop:1265 length:735 start_codon:yes stop_codon:yes gene_type:complete